MIWALAVFVIIIVAALPFVFEAQRRVIDQGTQDRRIGQFAQSRDGCTHYRWAGSSDGPVIVAIHGLTTPSVVWDDIIPVLVANGYCVLSYDLFGRGLSDAPSGQQDMAFFRRQLRSLLSDQNITEPVTLLGYSMGGSIAVDYAAAAPAQVKAVVLVASAGVVLNEPIFERVCRILPILGDWMHACFAAGRMRREPRSRTPIPISEMQAFQLMRRGYLPAILASRRGALAQRQSTDHQRMVNANIPVAAIWGRNDKIIPLAAMGVLAQWNRSALQIDIEGAGHGLLYTHPAETAAAIIDTLSEF